MSTEKHITVLGAGSTMGLPMARNLARAGFEVRGWNRTRSKARPLEEDGVSCSTPRRRQPTEPACC